MARVFPVIREYQELFRLMVARNLKIRYKNSVLGFFWSLLSPIFLIIIYATFLKLMKFSWDLRSLVTGIVVWQFFAMCLGDSVHAIVGNSNLVTKSPFPRMILPLAMVSANFINFLLSMSVLVVYLICVGADFGALYTLPLLFVFQFALCLGVSLIFSSANVFFRDTEHILSLVMLAWFFVTPVIYPIKEIVGPASPLADWMKCAYFLNPMSGIVVMYRWAFLSNAECLAPCLWMSFAMAGIILLIGVAVFKKCENRFADEL